MRETIYIFQSLWAVLHSLPRSCNWATCFYQDYFLRYVTENMEFESFIALDQSKHRARLLLIVKGAHAYLTARTNHFRSRNYFVSQFCCYGFTERFKRQ